MWLQCVGISAANSAVLSPKKMIHDFIYINLALYRFFRIYQYFISLQFIANLILIIFHNLLFNFLLKIL